MTEMKFHIFKQLPDEEGVMQEYPMCWDGQAVEFDTEDAAKRFLENCKENSEHDSGFFEDAIIKENILFYDGGHINCENLTVVIDDISGEQLLIELD